jgi:hypothetical protein
MTSSSGAPAVLCPPGSAATNANGAETFFVRYGIRRERNETGEEIALQIRHLLHSRDAHAVCLRECVHAVRVLPQSNGCLRSATLYITQHKTHVRRVPGGRSQASLFR